ncbi:predicted protein [Lichtheimia corymbifera JMRC:FSU:9682]|uniref:Uncharacterized protein n=1 Tax=Lichtheimia corymbifera JMRC:FSU:9682 TaxID=1263082 RepID=A0A068RP85_9FUNG|nr:predicted protein [Lichtheimia corymbifera JMRC:FSU:9682]
MTSNGPFSCIRFVSFAIIAQTLKNMVERKEEAQAFSDANLFHYKPTPKKRRNEMIAMYCKIPRNEKINRSRHRSNLSRGL